MRSHLIEGIARDARKIKHRAMSVTTALGAGVTRDALKKR
jgi:hypothetical protein